jgi:hypothetical protein
LPEHAIGVAADVERRPLGDRLFVSTKQEHHHLGAARRVPRFERYEICRVGKSRRRMRLVASAETQAAAKVALRTLLQEGEANGDKLAILDVATGRWLAR